MLDQVIKLFHAKVYMHLRTCLVVGLILVGYTVSAQKVVRNAAGEKIIQYEDGTWRYYEGRDSMLENDLWEDISKSDELVNDTLSNDQRTVYDYVLFQKYIAAAVRYESQMLDKVDASSIRAHSLEDQILSFENINDTTGVNQAKAEFKLLTDQRQNEQRRLSYARTLIKKILKVGKSEKDAKLAKIYVPGLNTEADLREQEDMLADKYPSVQQKDGMSGENPPSYPSTEKVRIGQSEERDSLSNSQLPIDTTIVDTVSSNAINPDTSAEISYAQPVPSSNNGNKPENNRDSVAVVSENLPSNSMNPNEETKTTDSIAEPLMQELKRDLSRTPDQVAQREQDSVAFKTDLSDQSNLEQKQEEATPFNPAKTMTPQRAVNENHWFSALAGKSPEYRCEFSFHGIDEFTKTQKKELKDELFFSYTDERLKSYLKDQDYMSCRGYLTSISGGFRYLTLVFSIASKNANREYGYIKNGSLLNLKLLDGETVSLFTQSENQGLLDPKSGKTVYKVRYPIEYQKEKLLLKSGIDKVRVVWSSGYEDYEVYNIDFFTNQFDCLNSK
ncbi:MAG: hypothetical protein IPL46_21365 [Saprospiraceae bacterium]|nr:hypothetical protein [Saprospiraceae bacterium]